MQCITPMVRLYNDVPKEYEDQKIWQRIVPRHEVFQNMQSNENYLTRIQDKNYDLERKGSKLRYQLIPCKHCWACKLNYSKDWATRLTWECKKHEHRYFITLTYDEENLPLYERMQYIDKDSYKYEFENDGTWTGSLRPEDVTKFIKRVRKKYTNPDGSNRDIKYFYAGEYGEKGQRPHYHMILFGVPLDIKQFYDCHIDGNHKAHWKSKELDELWGIGLVDVAEVEWGSCAYVARYCMKKINNDNDGLEYAKQGKIKEFVRMSRRPGIGVRYYNENKEHIYENDEVIITSVKDKVNVIKPPKAFDQRFKKEYPQWWETIKESRAAAAERSRQIEKELTEGISDLELYERKAQKLLKIQQLLPRILEE